VSRKHDGDKVIVFDKSQGEAALVFAFNFHPTESFSDYRIGVPRGGTWQVLLESDAPEFGGHSRISHETRHFSDSGEWDGRAASIRVYLPSRTCLVLGLVRDGAAELRD
jgi:1,4-alpha-glucan branching enzyme